MSPDEQVAVAKKIGRIAKGELPPTHGFMLFVFPFEQKPGTSISTYVANAERADCRAELRNILRKWDADALERGEPV